MINSLKMHRNKRLAFITLLCIFLFGQAFSQIEIPVFSDPVSDLTNTIDQTEYVNLRKQIIQFQDSTSNQIVVLMMPSLGENEIRDFGIKVLEKIRSVKKEKTTAFLF